MKVSGGFISTNGHRITVAISSPKGDDVYRIGHGGVQFPKEGAVSIDSSGDDTTAPMLTRSATITLDTRALLLNLYSRNVLDSPVTVKCDGSPLFCGYLEPMAFSQDFATEWCDLELSAIDALSALQYINYRNIGAAGVSYDDIKATAAQRTFYDYLTDALDCVAHDSQYRILYDGSRRLSAGSDTDIFRGLCLNELLFLGETEDDVYTMQEVVEEIMRYLSLHIEQRGKDFYVFDWATRRGSFTPEWVELRSSTSAAPEAAEDFHITAKNVADDSTSLSLSEVYNVVSVTCDITATEDLIESPLDDTTSPFSNKQLYMREYIAEYDKDYALGAFGKMLYDIKPDYDKASIVDWYMQIKTHPRWEFALMNGDVREPDALPIYTRENIHQEALLRAMSNGLGAALVSFGKVETKQQWKDNALTGTISMTDSLCVSVNGNGTDGDNAYPTPAALLAACPVATYHGSTSGGVFSPANDETTNYIVISGSIALNPITKLSGSFDNLKDTANVIRIGDNITTVIPTNAQRVAARGDDKERFYTRRYYKCTTPTAEPEAYSVPLALDPPCLVPFTDTDPQQYEFKHSYVGDSISGYDMISKVGVLACMLIIGDKCVVETGSGDTIESFEWRKFKEREECADDDEYFAQSFTIGFNPKIGDFIIGQKYDIQNNISYQRGLDVEGTAIAIKKSDHVSGAVRFMILGAVNAQWDDISRRHRTWFRKEKWKTTSVDILAHCSSIVVEDFKIGIYSDNGLITNFTDDELIYTSDEDESFINKKEESFRICSALTIEEAQELGVADTVALSTPMNAVTEEAVISIHDAVSGEDVKPEILYVDSTWREWRSQRVLLETAIEGIDPDRVNSLFTYPALPEKKFYVVCESFNGDEGTTIYTLKETHDDDQDPDNTQE